MGGHHKNALNLSYPWHLPLVTTGATAATTIPSAFDWRTKATLTPVQNQGQCASCWAFASTQMLADRGIIAGMAFPVLSAEYVKDCCAPALASEYATLLGSELSNICTCAEGGILSMGCDFLCQYGAPSSEVLPYATSTFNGQDAGSCVAVPSTATIYSAVKTSLSVVTVGPNGHAPASHDAMVQPNLSTSTIAANVTSMQNNILANGPLSVSMTVYNDLDSSSFSGSDYVDDVYVPNLSSGVVGGHAVTIVGWGVGSTQNTPYWIVRNSWGSTWNGNGYFLIQRGVNACGIESAAVSVTPAALNSGEQLSTSNVPDMTPSGATVSLWNQFKSLPTSEQIGISIGIIAGGVVLIGLLIALLVYSLDKGV